MKHVKNFGSFINEARGISHAIYDVLKDYVEDKRKKASYEEAKKIVAKEVEDWDLSKEDFEEAMKKFA